MGPRSMLHSLSRFAIHGHVGSVSGPRQKPVRTTKRLCQSPRLCVESGEVTPREVPVRLCTTMSPEGSLLSLRFDRRTTERSCEDCCSRSFLCLAFPLPQQISVIFLPDVDHLKREWLGPYFSLLLSSPAPCSPDLEREENFPWGAPRLAVGTSIQLDTARARKLRRIRIVVGGPSFLLFVRTVHTKA